ncbi:MAG: hypothetical protein ACLPSF_15755 [Methylocella sp.]
MPDIGLQNLGTIIPGARGEPAPPQVPSQPRPPQNPAPRPASPLVAAGAPQGAPAAAPIFAADAGDDPAALASGALGIDAPLELLAELASHGRTQTPLAIGLFGPPGCGKSVALNKLVAAIERLCAAAANAGSSPFVSPIATVRVDAADLNGHPATALAQAIYARLAIAAPALAIEASHAARDPDVAAREAFERLDAARLKLEAERRVLEEAEARRAKLADSLLYESPGSQIDAYATGRRGRIKAAMASFGIAGDPLLGYKDMVAEAADASGPSRTNFAMRSFFDLKGQKKRIILAIILAAIGFGLGAAFDNQSTWLGLLRAEQQTEGAANWIAANADWLLTLRAAAFIGAGLALLSNVLRGARLLQLVFRGESLLKAELSERRRDSDGHLGHQTRRVENLTADVERLSRQAAEAERRAGGLRAANPALAEPSPFAADAQKQEARRFVATVGALAQTRGGGAQWSAAPARPTDAPRRIIVALDNLDALPATRAREILTQAHSLLGPGYVSLIAVDPTRFEAGDPSQSLDKWIGAPLQVGEIAARQDVSAQIRDILGAAPTDAAKTPTALPDAKQSALDEPLSEAETRLLAALAPLAGPSARAVKRFVNLYRLLRTQWRDRPEQRGALAFMLALDAGGSPAEIAAVHGALAGAGGDAAFDPYHIGPRLAATIAALGAAQVRPSTDALRQAAAAVKVFSFNS